VCHVIYTFCPYYTDGKESVIIIDLQCVIECVLQEVVRIQPKAIIRHYKILVDRALVSYMITFK